MTAAGFGLAILASVRRLSHRDWFYPFAFPLGYVGVALIAPLLYLLLTRAPIGALQPQDITLEGVLILALTLLGLYAGTAMGLRLTPSAISPTSQDGVRYGLLRSYGRLGMGAAALLHTYGIAPSLGRPYGLGAVGDFSLQRSVDNLSVFLLFASVVLVTVANARLGPHVAHPIDLILFAAFAVPTLVLGSRGELVPPLLFALWARHTYVRRLRLSAALLLALGLVVAFQGVGGVRAGAPFYEDAGAALERTLQAIGTPVQVTSGLALRLPQTDSYTDGRTYVAALQRQLPSPLAIPLLGEPDQTGTFVYRDVIGFSDPNAGFAFALPAESYLNFGLVGSLGVALLVGGLLGYAYMKHSRLPTRPLHVLYPMLISALPLSLRTDAVFQIKIVVYPLLLIVLAYALASVRSRRVRTAQAEGAKIGAH
jgi:oligosaccharide repeat unit polymerase